MTEPDNETGTLDMQTVDEQAGRIRLVYIGTRPFKLDAADKPLMPGDIVDENHPYATHTAQLALRADFTE